VGEVDGDDRDQDRQQGTDVDNRRWWGWRRSGKIQIDRVCSPAPIVKLVTMISSKERAKASRPPRMRDAGDDLAGRRIGGG